MPNTRDPLSLRFSPESLRRIQAAADRLKIPKHTLCQLAVEAVVEAIEKSEGLVLPLEFIARRIPKSMEE